MRFVQEHNVLNAVVPVRLKLESGPGNRVKHSSTEPLRLIVFITTVHLQMVGRTSICTEQKKKAYTKCSSANIHVHVCLYHSCHRI